MNHKEAVLSGTLNDVAPETLFSRKTRRNKYLKLTWSLKSLTSCSVFRIQTGLTQLSGTDCLAKMERVMWAVSKFSWRCLTRLSLVTSHKIAGDPMTCHFYFAISAGINWNLDWPSKHYCAVLTRWNEFMWKHWNWRDMKRLKSNFFVLFNHKLSHRILTIFCILAIRVQWPDP